uniref:Uncharacterized protein n=1 Tax=Rhizophora mucronata TaxID=61149 RepID=A0A2P2PKA3_RHIMU
MQCKKLLKRVANLHKARLTRAPSNRLTKP